MRSIEAYDTLYQTGNENSSSGGDRLLTDASKTDALKSLGYTLNLIYSWLQSFKNNYSPQKLCTERK